MLKAVILIGGPEKGTRFRPLSLDVPKPLFPVAGLPLIQHHIEACSKLEQCREILLIGSYTSASMQQFLADLQNEYHHIIIRYLQEFTPLGTAGCMYHFRDQIRAGATATFFVLNGDVCAEFPLQELYNFHIEKGPEALVTIMSTEATKQQSLNYGCMVVSKPTSSVDHYVEKPNSYVSTIINCGIYICSVDVFQIMAGVFNKKHTDYYNGCNGSGRDAGYIAWEQEILAPLAGTNKLYSMQVTTWWSQLKTAGSAIYANRHYLELYRQNAPERLVPPSAGGDASCTILPDVHIHTSAKVHPTAVIGPNVSIGPDVVISAGVRVKESIVLANATIHEHALVMHSIVGRYSEVGAWARVEGTPSDPDPNKPFAKMDNLSLFNSNGRLNPSITILGRSVTVPPEVIVLNSIVLPHKILSRSFKHEIIL